MMNNFDTLPHDAGAESSLLAACLLDRQSLIDSLDYLSPGDFYSDRNQKIFQCMKECAPDSEPAILLAKFTAAGLSATVFADLSAVPMAVDIKTIAGIIKDKSNVRRAIEVSNAGIIKLMSCNGDARDVIDAFQQSVLAIDVSNDVSGGNADSIADLVNDSIDRYELAASRDGVSGIPTGLGDLDFILGGLQPSDLVILAARPSMGKTALAMNIIQRCGVPAICFSLEMSKQQLVDRMLSGKSKINLRRLTTGRLSDDDWLSLNDAAGKVAQLPIFIDDTPSQHFSEIRRRARIAYKKHNIGLIVIDYLQLMRGDGGSKSREAEISSISRALKAIAKELCIPVVALSQLNRELEKRSNKRPELSDLRESGQIEQDADVVMFIHRQEVFDKENTKPEHKGTAEIIIAKHRNGPTGLAVVKFVAETTTFCNLYKGKL